MGCYVYKQEETVLFLKELLTINSPTGYTSGAIHFLKGAVENLGYETSVTPKGNLLGNVEGEDKEISRGLSAHVDTLGLMGRAINEDGALSLTELGGPLTPTLESA